MQTDLPNQTKTDDELLAFIENFPSPEAIRRRMYRNDRENDLLKRMIRLALDADRAKSARQKADAMPA